MKNLFLLFLLFTAVIHSQDLKHFRSMSEAETLSFSNEIADQSRENWKLLKSDVRKASLSYYYIPIGTSDEEIKQIETVGLQSSGVDNFTVNYESFMEGQNLNMEIEGVKKYKFSSVTLKFLDAFPIWEKYFLNGATMDNVKDYKDKERRESNEVDIMWLYKFQQSNAPYWTIHKFY